MRRTVAALVMLVALACPSAADAAPPRIPLGPYRTVQRAYDLGRETLLVAAGGFRLHPLPTRLAGEVTMPLGAPGRRPVVVFLHGAHQSCEVPVELAPTQDFPCRPGWADVPSFEGYRYAAQALASYGFVVVSVDGNPVAPADGGVLTFPDGTLFTSLTWTDLRAKIVDAQLRRLASANGGETGDGIDFGVPLTRRLDLDRVGLVGHSRGGEGVVWASLAEGPRPYRIKAIVTLAPVDFFRRVIPDVPFAVVLPYCDGDVSDLEGGWFFDDARAQRRTAPLLQVMVRGANHNFFNRIWEDETRLFGQEAPPPGGAGGEPSPDPCSPSHIGKTRLSRPAQETVGAAVIVPFLRAYVAGPAAPELLAPLGVDAPPPPTVAGGHVLVSYQPPSERRLDVIRPSASAGLRRDLLGSAVRAIGGVTLGVCRYDPGTIRGGVRITGCGGSRAVQAHALAELRIGWRGSGGRVIAQLPPGRGDVREYDALTLRAAVDLGDVHLNPRGRARPFAIVLRDGNGREASVVVPATDPAVQWLPRGLVVLGTIRIPLAHFAGVDLARIAAIELRFDRTRQGRLLVTDVSFVR